MKNRFAQLDKFLAGKAISPYIPSSLSALAKSPIKFSPPHGGMLASGYEASILSDICESILVANDNEALKKNQKKLSIQANILIRSFAKVGIVALIDEATGYIKDKERFEYRKSYSSNKSIIT